MPNLHFVPLILPVHWIFALGIGSPGCLRLYADHPLGDQTTMLLNLCRAYCEKEISDKVWSERSIDKI